MYIITVEKAHYKEHVQYETMNTTIRPLQSWLSYCRTPYIFVPLSTNMATTKLRLRQTKSLELHPVSVEIGFVARQHSSSLVSLEVPPQTQGWVMHSLMYNTDEVWTKPESRRPDSPHGIRLNQQLHRQGIECIDHTISDLSYGTTCHIIWEIYLLTTQLMLKKHFSSYI